MKSVDILSNKTILISTDVIEFIEKNSSLYKTVETGGVIGGTGNVENNTAAIIKVSDGGPKAIRQRAYFSRDTNYCQSVIDEWAKASIGENDYLGEWHKHLEKSPHPSHKDIKTMQEIAKKIDYHINIPILIIIGISNKRDSIKLFLVNSRGNVEQAKWVISE